MYPILFSIGEIHIYNHGLLMVIGAIFGALVIYFLSREKGYTTSFIFDLFTYSFLGGLIGARFLYVIIYYNQFSSIKEMFFIWNGGMVSYGGMLGGLLVAYFILKNKKENIQQWFDIGIIGIMVGWSIGRIGCLLNGDSYGILSSAKIAIWGRIPTQLFESVWTLIVAIGLYLLLKEKERFRFKDGVIFWIGLSAYSIGRFMIDFWRDEAIFFMNLKFGQISSLLVLLFSLAIIYLLSKKQKEAQWS